MVGMSDLPDDVVKVILECLPVRDAVGTSVLSKKWQHKWATVSKLHLDYVFYKKLYLLGKPPSTSYDSLVKNIMLQRIGPLLEFELYIPELGFNDRSEINLIVCFALRNGVEKLSLRASGDPQDMPTFLFTAAQNLTELKLCSFVFGPHLLHGAFPNLKFLELDSITCLNLDWLSSFISCCPELQRFTLKNVDYLDQHLYVHAKKLTDLEIHGHFKCISLDGMQELVSLSMSLMDFNEDMIPCKDFTVSFFSQLSKIKYLRLEKCIFDLFVANGLPRKLPTLLYGLEKIDAVGIELTIPEELQFLLCLVRSSPNLQQLNVTVNTGADGSGVQSDNEAQIETDVFTDTCLLHLHNVRLRPIIGGKIELMLAEFLLSCSPVLQVTSVKLHKSIDMATKMKTMKDLMRYGRASRAAQLLCEYD